MIVARAIVLIAFTLAAICLSTLLFGSPYELREEPPARPREPQRPPAGADPLVGFAHGAVSADNA